MERERERIEKEQRERERERDGVTCRAVGVAAVST